MKKAIYKKVDERIEHITIHHEESVDENGNVIKAHDEVVEKVIPIMAVVYEDMTPEEIESIPKEEAPAEQTQDEKINELEKEINDLKQLIKALTNK